MDTYVVERTSVEARWMFDRMLPALPGPGSPAFAEFARGLHPYGITPMGVSVDAPTSKMGDVVLTIAVLNGRVEIRITLSWLELFVRELWDGDEQSLISIADLSLNAVRQVDSEIGDVNLKCRISSHLSFPSSSIDSFLGAHQVPKAADRGLITDAVAYHVTRLDKLNAAEMRFVLTKSVIYENALFIDINATYPKAPAMATLASWIERDFESIMQLIGLIEKCNQND